MTLDLNSTNIDTILVNISCCIKDYSKQMLIFSQTGNTKCFKDTRNKIIILDNIYDILEQNFATDYPTDCFTDDELDSLYQLALNLCKLCNCSK